HDASSVPDVHPPVTSLEVRLPLSADQPQEIPAIRLTPAELADMPLTRVSTSTIVTDGVITFTGILMRDLLDYVGYFPEAVTATALNDYEIDIPASDFTDFDVLLAWQADDEVLTRHDKGPFWIIYPRDDHIRLQDIRYDYRWVWQLHRLALHCRWHGHFSRSQPSWLCISCSYCETS